MEVFTIENLTFKYPQSKNYALDNVNLKVNKGEFLLICGKSGCGKTTLIKHMKAALAPAGEKSGDIYYNGTLLCDVPERIQAQEIGYVMQSPDSQIVTDKVWHELAFGLENLGYKNSVIRIRVAEMASYFGIQNWFHKDVKELSGGQKQILNLASIMAVQPEVIILDEPTSQLCNIAAQEFLALLKRIHEELGITVIIVEHRLENVFPMCDRVVVMDKGKIISSGNLQQTIHNIKDNEFFDAMPVPVKICTALGAPEYKVPVNVNEGRCFLEKYMAGKNLPKESSTHYIGCGRDNIIEASDVWFRYDKDGEDVLKGLNLNVEKGSLTCVLGGNGTGKTTMLYTLCGLLKPYRGKVTVKGKNVKKWGNGLYGKVIGMLPQNPTALFRRDNVYEDISECIIDEKNADKKIEEISRLLDITDILDMHPYDLSGGEQQRCALAKVLLTEPEILILDEPTKGFDGFHKRKLAEIFKKLLNDGITILMVSHDIEFCAEYADRCALCFDGGITVSGDVTEFFSGNSFYTTSANRMAREYFPYAVTAEEVKELCTTT